MAAIESRAMQAAMSNLHENATCLLLRQAADVFSRQDTTILTNLL